MFSSCFISFSLLPCSPSFFIFVLLLSSWFFSVPSLIQFLCLLYYFHYFTIFPWSNGLHWSEYLWLPADLTLGLWPHCSLLVTAPPIPFYNIVDTVSVTLNQCKFIFDLVACISAFLSIWYLIYSTFFCIMWMVCMILCLLYFNFDGSTFPVIQGDSY